jgi:hypothetical protein
MLKDVRARAFLAGVLGLLLAGCGGSSHSTSSSASSSTTTAAAATTTASAPAPSATTGASSTPTSTDTKTTKLPTPTHRSTHPTGGDTNVRLPATFTIGPGDSINPPLISAPAFIAVRLTVASGDGKQHHVLLRTPTPHSLTVPAGGRATLLVGGLTQGRYVLEVDGTSTGSLLIGGEPGP